MKSWRWIGWIISAAAVSYVVLGIEWGRAGEVLLSIDPGVLGTAAAIYLATFLIRGVRWADLLRVDVLKRTGPCSTSFLIGFAANHVLPARLGDVVRAFALRRLADVPVATGLSSVFVERVLDGLVVVGLGAAALAWAPPDATWARPLLGLFGLGFAGALAVAGAAVFVAARPRLRPKVLDHPRLARIFDRVVEGMATVADPLRLARVLAVTGLIWMTELGVYVVLGAELGVTLPPAAFMGVMVGLTLGLVAPSAPAFVGVFEGLVVAGLAAYGIDEARALAFALVLHVVHAVPGTLLGVAAAVRYGVRLDRQVADVETEPSAAMRTAG